MGKSQSKSLFEHIWRFDLTYNDSIWNTAIPFVILFENFEILFEQSLNPVKSLAYLLVDSARHQSWLCLSHSYAMQ